MFEAAGAGGELNDEQRRAATHAGGPLLVLAGAGTGKTRTLVARAAWLRAQGIPASRILLLTFTRRAADDSSGGPDPGSENAVLTPGESCAAAESSSAPSAGPAPAA